MQNSPIWPDTPERIAKARAGFDRLNDFTARYRNDASLRARLDGGDTSDALAELGIALPDGVRARIVADTPGTMHVVMPPDPNIELTDETLDVSASGKTAGTTGSIGSVASLGCVCGSASTASSGSSVGTTGTLSD